MSQLELVWLVTLSGSMHGMDSLHKDFIQVRVPGYSNKYMHHMHAELDWIHVAMAHCYEGQWEGR